MHCSLPLFPDGCGAVPSSGGYIGYPGLYGVFAPGWYDCSNITNHLTAIRSCCIIYNIDTTPFRDNRLPLFIKSIKINRSLQPSFKLIIDESILDSICKVCSHLPFPVVFKALYLLAYFSFLRLSSILPHSLATFDRTRHLCVADIIWSSQGAVIVVKLTKTLQDRCKVASVSLPN